MCSPSRTPAWRGRLPRLLHFALLFGTCAAGPLAPAAEEPFRPEAGKFPPLEKGYAYQGELVFVDHANRRGSFRVKGDGGVYFRNAPQPFALLPYAIVRYHGAPADLRDIPLGTIMQVIGYLPPDPKLSAVPILPVENRKRSSGYSGTGVAPAENHLLLLEDEPSYGARQGLSWRLHEMKLAEQAGTLVAERVAKAANGNPSPKEVLSFDAATRVWRGRECLSLSDLIAAGTWSASDPKTFNQTTVQLGLTWRPTLDGVFARFHISDIWLDESALQRAARLQTEAHKAFMRSRWLPGIIERVDYGKFGRATVTATFFGGMDSTLYADFNVGGGMLMNAAENTLKHTEGGTAGPAQMAARGTILTITQATTGIPLGSSGLQVSFAIDLITEGLRPGRIVRMRPATWPNLFLPREEYLQGGNSNLEERFPTPAIFPKYY